MSQAEDGNGVAFDLVHRLLLAIPRHLPGKGRLARLLMWPFLEKSRTVIADRFGNRFVCPSLREPIAAALYADGIYEPCTIEAIVASLPEEGIYLDVGANIGSIALAVAALRPRARVICVEALPEIAAILRTNAQQSGRSNVTVVEALAGAEEIEAVAFYEAPESSFGMGSVAPQYHDKPSYLPQRTLDRVLDELDCDTVDVVKLDVEGAEEGALKGLARRLRGARPPVVVFEFLDWAERRIAGQSPGDAQRLLMSIGYSLRTVEAPDLAPLERPLEKGGAMLVATVANARVGSRDVTC